MCDAIMLTIFNLLSELQWTNEGQRDDAEVPICYSN